METSRNRIEGIDVERAYEHCRSVTARSARTFYFASRFLAAEKRPPCYAVYAFCRYVDDLADEEGSGGGERIERWRGDLLRVYEGENVGSPELIAWGDVIRRYDIPRHLPELLIEGCLSDLRPVIRYETFNELYDYCYMVASVVGLMTSRIFGYADPGAEKRAIDLGVAMQLTNILRDVAEDAANNRIYLPLDELHAAGLTEGAILQGELSDRFREFMRLQVERARLFYRSAEEGIDMLEPDSRLTVRLMSRNYARILDVIEGRDYDVFSGRASVSLTRKIFSIPQIWFEGMPRGSGRVDDQSPSPSRGSDG